VAGNKRNAQLIQVLEEDERVFFAFLPRQSLIDE
jgi:hypothetical protein